MFSNILNAWKLNAPRKLKIKSINIRVSKLKIKSINIRVRLMVASRTFVNDYFKKYLIQLLWNIYNKNN